jgi:hypothetical protein
MDPEESATGIGQPIETMVSVSLFQNRGKSKYPSSWGPTTVRGGSVVETL